MKLKINHSNIDKVCLNQGTSHLEISLDITISIPVNKTEFSVSTRNLQNKISYPDLFSDQLFDRIKETALGYSNCPDALFDVRNIAVRQIHTDGQELSTHIIFDDLKLHATSLN